MNIPRLVAKIAPNGSGAMARYLTSVGNHLFFIADDGSGDRPTTTFQDIFITTQGD